MNVRSRLSFAAALIPVLALTACASSAPAAAPRASSDPEAAVTVDNCGTKVTFDAAPTRVVTIKSTSTEMLLALGLGDTIVGTAFQDGPLPTSLADAGTGLVSLSDFVPSEEAVLGVEPDLVYGGWESNFAADGAGERSELEGLGIHTYVSPAACKEKGYQPEKLSFEDIFDQITEVGRIFQVPDAAAAEVAREKKVLDGITPANGDHSALWYSSGDDTPYVGAGIGNPELILDTVGLVNIASDINDTWSSLGWESIVADDPDVIVLVDATWNTAQAKIDKLRENPVTANLSAVKNSRFLIVPFAAGEAGVRSADAAADLASQLADLKLD